MLIINKKRYLFLSLMLIIGSVLAGCLPRGAYDSARVTSALVNDVAKKQADFHKFTNDISTARNKNMNQLEDNAIELKTENESLITIWGSTVLFTDKEKDDRTKIYEFILQESNKSYEQHVEDFKRNQVRNMRMEQSDSQANLNAKKFGEISKALADLAKKPDFVTQAKFLVEFAQEIDKSIKELKKDSKKQTEEAEKELTEKEGKMEEGTVQGESQN